MFVPSVFILATAVVTAILVREKLKWYETAAGLLALGLAYAGGVYAFTPAGFAEVLWLAAFPLAAYGLLFIWYRGKRGWVSAAFFIIIPSIAIVSGFVVAAPLVKLESFKRFLLFVASRTGFDGCTVHGLTVLFFIISALLYLSSPANAIIKGVLKRSGVFPEDIEARRRPGGDDGEGNTEPNNPHDADDDEYRGADRNAVAAVGARNFVVVTAIDADTDTARRGAIIGTLERWVAFVLVLTGQYTALAFVIAAKSIARYKRINEEEKFGEYFLIGTLTSIGIALFFGIIVKKSLA